MLLIMTMSEKPTYAELEKQVQALKEAQAVLKKTEAALRDSEEKYRKSFESITDSITVTRIKDGLYLYVNDEFCHQTGYSRNEVLGRTPSDISLYAKLAERDQFIGILKKYGKAEDVVVSFRRKNGEVYYSEFSAKPISYAGEDCLLAQSRDITKRKRVEEELRESEEKFRSFVENANDIVYSLSLDSIFSYVSPNWTEILGHDLSEVVGKHFESFVHPDDFLVCLDFLKKVLTTGEKQSGVEYRVKHKDGGWRWHTTNASPIRDSEGQIASFVGIAHDITDRLLAEEALRKSEALLSASQQLAKVGGWEWDVKSQTMFWTKETYRIHDFQGNEVAPGSSDHIELSLKCYDPEDRPIIMGAFKRCIEKGQAYDLEFPFTTAMGHRRWIRTAAKPVLEGDRIVKVTGNIMDITVQRQAEEALRESEERFRGFIENSPVPMLTMNTKGEFTYANKRLLKMTGYNPEEWANKPFNTFVYPEDLGAAMERVQKRISGQGIAEPYEIRIYHASGDILWVEISPESIYETDESDEQRLVGVQCFVQDVTSRKLAEQALKESEEKFRLISGQSLMAITIIQDNRIIYANQAYSEMIGYPPEEIMNWTLVDAAKLIHPDDYDFVVKQALKKTAGISNGIVPRYSYRVVTKSGEVRWVDQYSKTITYKGRPANLTTAIDINDKKQSEQELKYQKRHLESLVLHSGFSIVTLDEKHGIISCNRHFETLFQFQESEILGRNLDEVLAGKDFMEEAVTYTKKTSKGKAIQKRRDTHRR